MSLPNLGEILTNLGFKNNSCLMYRKTPSEIQCFRYCIDQRTNVYHPGVSCQHGLKTRHSRGDWRCTLKEKVAWNTMLSLSMLISTQRKQNRNHQSRKWKKLITRSNPFRKTIIENEKNSKRQLKMLPQQDKKNKYLAFRTRLESTADIDPMYIHKIFMIFPHLVPDQ